ncbi:hypothetical protein AADG42_10680 [Ammonicoccus fulvus]|uniref:Ig-like domain-containing protein n=1 Tax=Ammonicoccus fulvus TaxID=3138240 RepID=A0ABZ3FNX8_9ACTN
MSHDPWGMPASPPPDKPRDPWAPVPPGQGGPSGQGMPPGQGGHPGQGRPPGQSGYPGEGVPPGQGALDQTIISENSGWVQSAWPGAQQPPPGAGIPPGMSGPPGPPGQTRAFQPAVRQRPKRTLAVVIALLAGVVALAVVVGAVTGLFGSVLERFGGDRTSAGSEPTVETQAPAPSEEASVTGPVATTTPSPTPRERTGREEPNRTPDVVSVQSGSSGSACSATVRQSSWGAYPLGDCRTWKPATGLISGSALSTGPISVTCQADLREPNPIYTANQTNTWWFWAQADNGTWDWFPETALAQGASNQSVNGVALCR